MLKEIFNKEKVSWVLMADPSSTTIAVKKTVLKRLHKLKPHPKCTHADTIAMLIDSYDKKQVKLNVPA